MFQKLIDRIRGFGKLRARAWHALSINNHQDAWRLIQRGLISFSRLSAFQVLAVRYHLHAGDEVTARELLESYQPIHPLDEYDAYELAEAYRLLEMFESSRTCYRLASETENAEIRSLALRGLGVVEFRCQDYERALTYCVESFLQGRRTIHPWMTKLGHHCDRKVVSQAIERLCDKRANDVSDCMPIAFAAYLAAYHGDWDRAIDLAEKATKLHFFEHRPQELWDDNAPPIKPDVLIIGGMKCGTTSMFEQFSFHPRFVPPLKKELHFRFHEWPEAFYLAQFPRVRRDQGRFISGEASPSYYCNADVDAIKRLLPATKVVFLRRNPVDRTISHLFHNKRIMISESSRNVLREGWKAILEQHRNAKANQYQSLHERFDESKPFNRFLLLSCYDLFLPKWRSQYGKDQLLELDFVDYAKRNQETMNRVYDFIGLPSHPIQESEIKYFGSYRASSQEWDECRAELLGFFDEAQQLMASSDGSDDQK